MLFQLSGVLVFMVASVFFVAITLLVSRILAPKKESDEKVLNYECGEDSIGLPWIQFNIRFYVIALVFLIFEVEIVFLYPWATVFKEMGFFTFIEMMIFVTILLVGLAYAWVKGDLTWVLPRPKYKADFDTSDVPRYKHAAVAEEK